MTAEQYRAALSALGLSQQAAGRWLGVSPKTAQNYAKLGPSGPAAVAIRMALEHGLGEPLATKASWGRHGMTTMLESAARAIHAIDSRGATERVAASMWANNRAKVYEKMARAAILAIREPGDVALLNANCVTDADAYEAWTAMIDAALYGDA